MQGCFPQGVFQGSGVNPARAGCASAALNMGSSQVLLTDTISYFSTRSLEQPEFQIPPSLVLCSVIPMFGLADAPAAGSLTQT